MNFREFIGVVNGNVDAETGETLSHSEVYGRAIDKLGGVDRLSCFVPFSRDKIKRALAKGDECLNTLPMRVWDYASGFFTDYGSCVPIKGSPLRMYLAYHGVASVSNCEGVCLLKEVARRWATLND